MGNLPTRLIQAFRGRPERSSVLISIYALIVLVASLWAVLDWSAVTAGESTAGETSETDVCVDDGAASFREIPPSLTKDGAAVPRQLAATVALTWGLFLVFTAIGLVVAYCGAVSWMRWRRRSEFPGIVIAAASLGLIVGLLLSGLTGPSGLPGFTDLPGPSGQYLFHAYEPFLDCLHRGEGWFRITEYGNWFVIFVTFLLIGSVWQEILGLPAEIVESTSGAAAKDCLRKANEEIVLHLYLGSALLVTSVIALYGYYNWPSVIADGAANQSAIKALALIIVVLYGSAYTLILVSVLGPAIWSMNTQAVRLAQDKFEQTTKKEARAWAAENGLRSTGFQEGFQILAVLGPLLTGPILQLLSSGFVG